jgi:hypothetical protein
MDKNDHSPNGARSPVEKKSSKPGIRVVVSVLVAWYIEVLNIRRRLP